MPASFEEQWDCFIAYPGPQRALAERLAGHLAPRIRVFFDKRALKPGDHWPEVIGRALDAAPVTVVVVAPQTEQAFYEQEEIARAVASARDESSNRRVVPIFVDGMSPTDAGIPYGLRVKQGYVVASPADLLSAAEGIAARAQEMRQRIEMESVGEEPREVSQPVRAHLATMQIEVEELTKDQYRVINQLRYMRRVRISGSAGSGKTLVAAEKAMRLAKGGSRVLFLCHNPLLAEYVQQLTASSGVEVRDVARWVGELADTSAAQDDTEWTHYHEPAQGTLDRAFERLTAGEGRVDAIVVDEGQDFRAEWWTVVEAALKDAGQGYLYIFHDNNQSLLAYRGDYPVREPHVDLSRNCRNAGRVLELMRCFDSSAPEAELGLHARGRVEYRRYEAGREESVLAATLVYLERERLIEDAVIITTADGPLSASPLAGYETGLPTTGPWQDEVRAQFSKVLTLYNRRGVTDPEGGEDWIATELARLGTGPAPGAADVDLVRRLAGAFSLTRDVRARLPDRHAHRNAFGWHLGAPTPRLRKRFGGPPLAAEVVMFFERPDWARGLPAPKTVLVQPFYLPRTPGTIPLYRVSDFKGLEAEAVVLVMRGRVGNQKEATYVGISRARSLLCILADGAAASALPKSFTWD